MKKKTLHAILIASALLFPLLSIVLRTRADENSICSGRPEIRYTIAWGDTLMKISQRIFGTPRRYFDIARENGIADPNHIEAGTALTITCPANSSLANLLPPPSAVHEIAQPLPPAPAPLVPITPAGQAQAPYAPPRHIPMIPPPSPQWQRSSLSYGFVNRPAYPVSQSPIMDLPASIPKRKRAPQRSYEVTIAIKEGQVQGIAAGTFPAVFLENQKKTGIWGKRKPMIAVIEKANTGYTCDLVLEKAPPRNAAVAIDFGNGASLKIESDLLQQGMPSERFIPRPLPKSAYAALDRSFPKQPNRLLTVLRVATPVAIQAGTGFAIGGPIGVVTAPAMILSGIAEKKIGDHARELQAVQHPSLRVDYVLAEQQDKIAELQQEVEALKKRLDEQNFQ